jgi:hypothetical protein
LERLKLDKILFLDLFLLGTLVLWPVVGILSIMVLGGPGASNDPGKVYWVMATLCYPIVLFVLRCLLRKPFFFVPPPAAFAIVTIVVVGALWLVGFIEMWQNTRHGIRNEGYTLTTDRVYFNGEIIPEADPQTFQIENGGDPARETSAHDRNHSYKYGKIATDAGTSKGSNSK